MITENRVVFIVYKGKRWKDNEADLHSAQAVIF